MYLYMTGNTLYICRICICLISSFLPVLSVHLCSGLHFLKIHRSHWHCKKYSHLSRLYHHGWDRWFLHSMISYIISLQMYLLYTHLLYIYPYCYLLYTILSISDVSPLQEQGLSVSFLIQHREDMHSYPQAPHQMLCCTVPVHSLPRI